MMDLKMEVYTPALELIGVLEIQKSVIWESRAFSTGSFSVDSLITEESRSLLVPENIIWIEGDTAGIIEYVKQQADKAGPYITVSGRDLTGILDRRILWGLYSMSGTVSDIMRELVDDCCIHPTRGNTEARKIPGLVLAEEHDASGEKIRMQKTGGTLLEALELLGEAYQVAFGVRFNPQVPQMEFWTRYGADRSTVQDTNEPVFYSRELDDVLQSEYTYNSDNYKNVTLVAGEGEGKDRIMVTVEEELEPEPQPPTPIEPVEYTVTLAVDPAGGGFALGGGTVESGTSVTVTAAPSGSYSFVGWRENGEIVSTDAAYTFTVSSDRSLTAVFAAVIPEYTVSAAADPAAGGTVSGGGTYQAGETVTLTAAPADGYEFVAWRENGTDVSTGETYTFTAGGDRTITAVFAVIPSYTVTAVIDPSGAGTVTGAGTYRRGTSVTVTAAPADGYTFSGWQKGTSTVAAGASYTFTVTENVTLTAAFAAASRLPAGYTEVEYIAANDATSRIQSIDLRIASQSTLTVDFYLPDPSTLSGTKFIYQYYYASGSMVSQLDLILYSKALRVQSRSGGSTTYLANNIYASIPSGRYICTYNAPSKTISCGGKSVSVTQVSGTNSPYFSVGAGTATTNNGIAGLRIYSIKATYTGTSTLAGYKTDLVPCKNPSGTVGLYDINAGKFYGPASTSHLWTAGPAV